jgi:hypothetical protein
LISLALRPCKTFCICRLHLHRAPLLTCGTILLPGLRGLEVTNAGLHYLIITLTQYPLKKKLGDLGITMIGIMKIGTTKTVSTKISVMMTDAMRISIAKNGVKTSCITTICIEKACSMTISIKVTGVERISERRVLSSRGAHLVTLQ